MEKLNLTKNTMENKKIFFRKEIEPSRLGEELYEDEVLSQYSVYLLRKFELAADYEKPEQFEAILNDLPEQFNNEFEDCVVRNLYVRVTQKAVYITLFLALAHPLSKLQISDLRTWIGSIEVPELPLEHVSAFTKEVPLEMMKGLQETNSEVLLLTEMMNQFSENLNEIYKEVQAVKTKKTPPVVRVVQSKVAAKQAVEAANAKEINATNQKVNQLMEDFSQFKKEVEEKLAKVPKPKKPPKFKIVFGTGDESAPTLENRLDDALKKIDSLTQKITLSQQEVKQLNKVVEENKAKKPPKLTFSKTPNVNNEQHQLADKLAVTSEEVTSISQQLQQINQKLSTVETNVLEVKTDPEVLARLEKDRGQLKETASETVKMNQVIQRLTEKLQSVESELTTVKAGKKKIPVVKLTKNESMKNLTEQHQKDQEQLKSNAVEIKKLTQTVSKVDVQLIKAHQKIAELEQKMRQPVAPEPKEVPINTEKAVIPKTSQAHMASKIGPAAPPVIQQAKPQVQTNRSFPTKESFLQATKPQKSVEERPTVTLAIEEMLDRVSEQTVETREKSFTEGYDQEAYYGDENGPSLRRLKKLEWDIHSFFQKGKGIGHKGMMPKDNFYANIRNIEVLPYLWASVFEKEQKDIMLGKELSCQDLIEDLPEFLDDLRNLSKKRKVMGKWIYCPKEVEQKMEGYKLLGEYLETYLARQNSGQQ